jgi:hypothetical protein
MPHLVRAFGGAAFAATAPTALLISPAPPCGWRRAGIPTKNG